ncbi:MAG: methyltransferase domain-containing protein, partial [Deltaproteobacteria bacterium]|nr:methyltransferase domain-containing protein [Deltaproteobacteria bacterium]
MITVDFDRLNITPGCRILDVGCGTGRHTCGAFRFRKVVAMGVDIKFDDVFEADSRLKNQERLGEHGGGMCKVSVADIYNLPFRDNYFDLVICSEILEHLHDEQTAVSEAARVL